MDLKVIEYVSILDERGFFKKMFSQKKLENLVGNKTIKQVNKTFTKKKGTVRGLHFQYSPHQEIKIVSCLKGKVWDVAVDLRKGSSTFLKYHAILLSEDDLTSYFVPAGFAHGFQTMTSNCEMLYLHTEDYNKSSEGAINALDPMINIKWPKPITMRSTRDISHAMLTENFKGIELK